MIQEMQSTADMNLQKVLDLVKQNIDVCSVASSSPMTMQNPNVAARPKAKFQH